MKFVEGGKAATSASTSKVGCSLKTKEVEKDVQVMKIIEGSSSSGLCVTTDEKSTTENMGGDSTTSHGPQSDDTLVLSEGSSPEMHF